MNRWTATTHYSQFGKHLLVTRQVVHVYRRLKPKEPLTVLNLFCKINYLVFINGLLQCCVTNELYHVSKNRRELHCRKNGLLQCCVTNELYHVSKNRRELHCRKFYSEYFSMNVFFQKKNHKDVCEEGIYGTFQGLSLFSS